MVPSYDIFSGQFGCTPKCCGSSRWKGWAALTNGWKHWRRGQGRTLFSALTRTIRWLRLTQAIAR